MNRLQQLHDDFSNINILYVEDEDLVRDMTVEFLSNIFKNIDTAINGQDGLDLFKKNTYSLVISDLRMPKMGGREMLEQINKLNSGVALIVMTASDREKDGANVICDSYLNKPVMFMDFIESIESLRDKILSA